MNFNHLIPELSVSNLEKSIHFYVDILGFTVEYERPEKRFVYLSFQGSQLMLDEGNSDPTSSWYTGPLEYPRGRGIHFQLDIDSLVPMLASLEKYHYPIKNPPSDYWFRENDMLIGMRGVLVMDPDGYLLMFNEDLGKKPLLSAVGPGREAGS